ncbi:hypothetical protein EV179_005296 [Coemansia sp. RSA 487]|nr:hypothetical protein EV179_005296 [Coemansia sp. RSA 487]
MAIFIALAEVGPQKMLEIKADSRAAIGALSALHHRDPTTVMVRSVLQLAYRSHEMQDPAMDQIAQVLKNLIESQNARDIRQEERDRRQERDTKHEAEFSELRQTNQEILTSLKNLNTVPAAPRQGNFRRLQPRKYCVGLVSYKDELHILLNTRDAINHAVVGKLPFVDSVRKCIYRSRENAHITFKEGNGELVVRALAMIFGMSLEQCGFLVPQLGGVYHQFGLLVEKPSIDQAEAVLSAVAGSTPTANCLINLSIGGYLSGRVMFPVGTTSWVHKASVDVRTGNNSFQGSAVVKIQWRRSSRRTESSVYRVLHDMKIPNVPQVIFSGCIGMGTLRIESRCDVLVLEPCGVGIIQYVQKLAAGHETNHWMLLDVACGYIHTLYAAWSGTTYKILHRDISSGNLMVANNSARVIDWEYGLLFNINRRPGVNADSLTGTMVYASMAVLRGVTLRTPFDDIESLFYVLMHAIEKAYNNHGKGRGTAQNKTAQRLWDGNLSVEELINERITVFGSGIEYKKRLGAKCPSSWIVLVESMYNALAIGTQATLSDVTFDIDFDECMQRLVQDLQPLLQEREMDSNHYTALLRFCNTVGKRTSAA